MILLQHVKKAGCYLLLLLTLALGTMSSTATSAVSIAPPTLAINTMPDGNVGPPPDLT